MDKIKTFISLLMSFFMLISNEITAVIPSKPSQAKTETQLSGLADYFDTHPINDEIIVVGLSGVTQDEKFVLQCLQGLVGRDKATILINYGGQSRLELNELEKAGYKLSYSDENGNSWTLKNLITRFSSYISDNGYVLYSDSNTTEQMNMAFNYSTVYGYLAVPVSVENIVKDLGLQKAEDLTDDDITIEFQRNFYRKHKEVFRKDSLVHLLSTASGLRDFAVQQKIFITFTRDDDYVEKAFREEILSDLEPASLILGWCQFEVAFTESISSFGHFVVPSDHSMNMSILNSFDLGKINLGQEVSSPELDPTKHYVAIVYSDGDNAQWISNGYSEFYKWQSYDVDAPISWTFAPLMNEFSPVAMKRAKENLGDDSFITGPTGIGYGRIMKMSPEELEVYSEKTASIMAETGLTTVTILDKPLDLPEGVFVNKLSYFSRYDSIKGGILQIDPTRYEGGKGKVFFTNDKPFISVRMSLWHPSNSADEVTEEWLKEQAEIINNLPADINSINGYSVINVHPWTVDPDDLKYFVSQLDSDVVVISADELIMAVTENIPHKTAAPQ